MAKARVGLIERTLERVQEHVRDVWIESDRRGSDAEMDGVALAQLDRTDVELGEHDARAGIRSCREHHDNEYDYQNRKSSPRIRRNRAIWSRSPVSGGPAGLDGRPDASRAPSTQLVEIAALRTRYSARNTVWHESTDKTTTQVRRPATHASGDSQNHRYDLRSFRQRCPHGPRRRPRAHR